MKRGDVVLVDFSLYDPSDKVRPALVIQNDRDNVRMSKTIVALITGNTRRAGEDTQYLIDAAHPDLTSSGLSRPSAINCSNLYTIQQAHISRTLGALSSSTMDAVNERLKAALAIP
jgi:mRNA-degrading endonuclease toxin of MazEF toxin-antitoxin module